MVTLLDKFGVDTIMDALDGQPSEAEADVVVSTAHKAKGREWPTVRLADDFPDEHDPGVPEQTRLAYVAVTRAQHVLDCNAVGLVNRLRGLGGVGSVEEDEDEGEEAGWVHSR
jgi:hypothetical protein